jgi:preprotein translocase subunit YajC
LVHHFESFPNVIQFTSHFLLFAQDAAPPDKFAGIRFIVMIAGILLMGYFMLIRPQKQKEQEMRKLVQNLKENDRVVTIGGIHGVVTNVQRDSERVTIRVDESTGAKLRINLSAISRVLTGDEAESNTASSIKA